VAVAPEAPPAGWTATEPRRRPTNPEAGQCFDRGLACLATKDYQQACAAWERACDLDPDNGTYQRNLKRLRARMEGHNPGQETVNE
jgi:tetratricopeptide (TPR) repeat protein